MKVVNGVLTDVESADIKDGVFLVPEGVKTIGTRAFSSCTGLQSITLPEGVEKIEKSAFRFYSSLQSIVLPESLKKIGDGAFEYCPSLRFIYIFASNSDEHQRIKNLLFLSLNYKCNQSPFVRQKPLDMVVTHEFTQRLPDMVNKELQRILQTATSYPLRRCAKSIAFFPEELFAEINSYTNKNDNPFYQKARRDIDKLALPDSEEAFATYAEEVKRLVDNTIAESNKVLDPSSRQTGLYDIVRELIENIENRAGKGSVKVEQLHTLKRAILAHPVDEWAKVENDFIRQIQTICETHTNKIHFWGTPESVGEFEALLKDKGFIREATETAPLLK